MKTSSPASALTVPISELQKQNPAVYTEFIEMSTKLENHYKDMQDLEFTIEHGKLFMLQCRSGKRTGPAAVQIAVDMVREGLISEREAVGRVTGSHVDQLLHPAHRPGGSCERDGLCDRPRGLPRRCGRVKSSSTLTPLPSAAYMAAQARRCCWCATRPTRTTCTECWPRRAS